MARLGEALLREIERDDPLGAREARADHGAEADEPAAEHGHRRARLDLRRVEGGAEAGREAAGKRRAAFGGASGLTFASAISGITVYSAKVEVPMKWRTGSPSRARRVVRREGTRHSAGRGSQGTGSCAGSGSARTRRTRARTA